MLSFLARALRKVLARLYHEHGLFTIGIGLNLEGETIGKVYVCPQGVYQNCAAPPQSPGTWGDAGDHAGPDRPIEPDGSVVRPEGQGRVASQWMLIADTLSKWWTRRAMCRWRTTTESTLSQERASAPSESICLWPIEASRRIAPGGRRPETLATERERLLLAGLWPLISDSALQSGDWRDLEVNPATSSALWDFAA
jgi:hypothetical protein